MGRSSLPAGCWSPGEHRGTAWSCATFWHRRHPDPGALRDRSRTRPPGRRHASTRYYPIHSPRSTSVRDGFVLSFLHSPPRSRHSPRSGTTSPLGLQFAILNSQFSILNELSHRPRLSPIRHVRSSIPSKPPSATTAAGACRSTALVHLCLQTPQALFPLALQRRLAFRFSLSVQLTRQVSPKPLDIPQPSAIDPGNSFTNRNIKPL